MSIPQMQDSFRTVCVKNPDLWTSHQKLAFACGDLPIGCTQKTTPLTRLSRQAGISHRSHRWFSDVQLISRLPANTDLILIKFHPHPVFHIIQHFLIRFDIDTRTVLVQGDDDRIHLCGRVSRAVIKHLVWLKRIQPG